MIGSKDTMGSQGLGICGFPKMEPQEPMEAKVTAVWSECYQDLGSYCRLPQDELHTPTVSLQNEFNFEIDGQSKDFIWESSPDFQHELWEPNEWPLPSPTVYEENNNLDIPSVQPMIAEKDASNVMSSVREDSFLKTHASNPMLSDKSERRLVPGGLAHRNPLTLEEPLLVPQVEKPVGVKRVVESQGKKLDLFKMPTVEVPVEVKVPTKPKLKLNIAAASPAIPITSMDTPDVLQPFTESSSFDLLSYVCDNSDELNILPTAETPTISRSPESSTSCRGVSPVTDHDYTGVGAPKQESYDNFIDVSQIKEEPLSPSSSSTTTIAKTSRKRRSTANSDDFVFDSDEFSDSDSMEWSPSVPKKKAKTTKRRTSKASSTSGSSRSGKPVKREEEEGEGTLLKYRELRDRNNEASRRSRMNRKRREEQLRLEELKLQEENIRQKAKAEQLERLVKKLRSALMNIVLKK